MKVLLATTEDFIKRGRAAITADAAEGATTILVPDTTIFVTEYAVLGVEGSDTAELLTISGGDGDNTLTISALRNKHYADEPLTAYRYNQRKFYGSTSASGSFTELTTDGSPVDIAVNNPQGTVLEYIGGEGYLYFKATYWNATTSDESDIADANTVLADESTRYCSIYDIRKQAGMTENPYYDDGKVEAKRKQAENEVNSLLYERYVLPLVNSQNVAEIPFLVQRCTILLAAGYIAYEEYEDTTQGVKWLGEARGILNSIQKGVQRLIGTDGQELSTKILTAGVRGFPDTVDNEDGPIQSFTRNQQF